MGSPDPTTSAAVSSRHADSHSTSVDDDFMKVGVLMRSGYETTVYLDGPPDHLGNRVGSHKHHEGDILVRWDGRRWVEVSWAPIYRDLVQEKAVAELLATVMTRVGFRPLGGDGSAQDMLEWARRAVAQGWKPGDGWPGDAATDEQERPDPLVTRVVDLGAAWSSLSEEEREAIRELAPDIDPDADPAAVWDKGYASGLSNAMRRMSDEPNAPTTPNPYRTAAADAATPQTPDTAGAEDPDAEDPPADPTGDSMTTTATAPGDARGRGRAVEAPR